MVAPDFSSHQVDILYDSNRNPMDPICVGTLISTYLVLTVFSCLKEKNETQLKVRGSGMSEIRNVNTIHSYPALKRNPAENDIAVLLLESNFHLDESFMSIDIMENNSTEQEELFALSPASSSTSCENVRVERTALSGPDSECPTDKPNSVCVKAATQSSCSVPLIGSGLICKLHGLSFLCGALAGSKGNARAYTDISKYVHWIRLTFDMSAEHSAAELDPNELELGATMLASHAFLASNSSTTIPYQLSLQDGRRGSWEHICGAVIIDTKTALTAAHCFEGTFKPSDFRVVAGITELESSSNSGAGQILLLQKIIRHNGYKNQNVFLGNDIAIIHVNGFFVYNENVTNIWISPPNGTKSTDFPGRVSGWGQTTTFGAPSNLLQYADMEILEDSECNKTFTFLKPSMICTIHNVSRTCKGDSGGPLVIKSFPFNQNRTRDLLVGIGSFSRIHCNESQLPNGFTKVSLFYNWIKENRASKCGATEFQCVNGQCIDECSVCSGLDECGDGSDQNHCEEKMDLGKMRQCLRKNQEEFNNAKTSLTHEIHELKEKVRKLEGKLRVESEDDDEGENGRPRHAAKVATKFERETWNLAVDLYKGVKQKQVGNFVMSPLGLTTLMTMLQVGAGGETAMEIQHLFKFEPDSDVVIDHAATLFVLQNQEANETSGVELVTASRIFANSANANLLPDYTEVSFLGEVESFSFADRKRVVEKTNEWVKNRTRGKISKLVKETDFTEETSAVLLNAVYFKAPWKHPFNKSLTKQEDFHVSWSKSVQVDMMHILAEFPYADLADVEATALFLPYKGDRLSMIIYLPWNTSNLARLEEKLEHLVPAEIYNRATPQKISIYLPKFNISSSLDLKPVLNSLGLQKMFNRATANFTKMTSTPEFHVSKIHQHVFIQVNEEGTEVAAAGGKNTSTTTVLKVNRPFMFQIFDELTSIVLCTGRITNPNGIEPPDSSEEIDFEWEEEQWAEEAVTKKPSKLGGGNTNISEPNFQKMFRGFKKAYAFLN